MFVESLITPGKIIAFERPLFFNSNEEVNGSINNIEEDIEAHGGLENMGQISIERYELEMGHSLKELAYRN